MKKGRLDCIASAKTFQDDIFRALADAGILREQVQEILQTSKMQLTNINEVKLFVLEQEIVVLRYVWDYGVGRETYFSYEIDL